MLSCSVCFSSVKKSDKLRVCLGSCGKLIHVKCLDKAENSSQEYVCSKCRVAGQIIVSKAQQPLFDRIVFLTNLVSDLYAELKETRFEVKELKSKLESVPKPIALENRTRSASGSSLLLPTTSDASTSQPRKKRTADSVFGEDKIDVVSETVRRKQSSSTIPEVAVRRRSSPTEGTGNEGIPFDAAPIRPKVAQTFVSRIVSGTSADTIYRHVKSISTKVKSVQALKVKHDYSSFVIRIEKDDEEKLMSPVNWRKGMIIKPFFGRVHEERIDETVDGDKTHPNDEHRPPESMTE